MPCNDYSRFDNHFLIFNNDSYCEKTFHSKFGINNVADSLLKLPIDNERPAVYTVLAFSTCMSRQ